MSRRVPWAPCRSISVVVAHRRDHVAAKGLGESFDQRRERSERIDLGRCHDAWQGLGSLLLEALALGGRNRCRKRRARRALQPSGARSHSAAGASRAERSRRDLRASFALRDASLPRRSTHHHAEHDGRRRSPRRGKLASRIPAHPGRTASMATGVTGARFADARAARSGWPPANETSAFRNGASRTVVPHEIHWAAAALSTFGAGALSRSSHFLARLEARERPFRRWKRMPVRGLRPVRASASSRRTPRSRATRPDRPCASASPMVSRIAFTMFSTSRW